MYAYYVDISDVDELLFQRLLQNVPLSIKHKVLKFRYDSDRYLALFGKLLLKFIYMEQLNLSDPLNDLTFTPYGKPSIDDNLSFNISHSGNYVICAVSSSKSIGIDIEKCVPINIYDFRSVLTDKEWIQIQQLVDPIPFFYDLWTIKESVIKANGLGLSLDIKKINVFDSTVHVSHKNETLFYRRLELDPNYASAIASYEKFSTIDLRKVKVTEFK